MDSGMPLHEAKDVEVRMTILSEVMQLARQTPAQAVTARHVDPNGTFQIA